MKTYIIEDYDTVVLRQGHETFYTSTDADDTPTEGEEVLLEVRGTSEKLKGVVTKVVVPNRDVGDANVRDWFVKLEETVS